MAHPVPHPHQARTLHFRAFPDPLLLLLADESAGRGLRRLADLLEGLLLDRQALQPPPPANPALEALLPF